MNLPLLWVYVIYLNNKHINMNYFIVDAYVLPTIPDQLVSIASSSSAQHFASGIFLNWIFYYCLWTWQNKVVFLLTNRYTNSFKFIWYILEIMLLFIFSGSPPPQKFVKKWLNKNVKSLTPRWNLLYNEYKKTRGQKDYNRRVKTGTSLQ